MGSSANSGSTSGSGGKTSHDDWLSANCPLAFNAALQDVEQSEYYLANGSLPPVGTILVVVNGAQLFAQTNQGVIVGILPSPLAYIAECMSIGFSYTGVIESVSTSYGGSITAGFVATPPS